MKVLITGSSGLIGSEAVCYYNSLGAKVWGIDNDMRKTFFGPNASTKWRLDYLKNECKNFTPINEDIRNQEKIFEIVDEIRPDLLIHAAAQPSHDLAAQIPFLDFEVNANGTLNLLEACRQKSKDTVFIFMSTNKVYGDSPNYIKLKEMEKRWDFDEPEYKEGIAESFSIDQSLHSLFGTSKVAADILVQEYGRNFSMPTVTFRGGCLTGSGHSGVELHGFLSYFFRAAQNNIKYTIYGYKGKQVRDQIHSIDVLGAFDEFYKSPRAGEVYNLGGGKENSISILECIDEVGTLLGKKIDYNYTDQNRVGDHICYYTDLSKFKYHYPNWKLTMNLNSILEEMAGSQPKEWKKAV